MGWSKAQQAEFALVMLAMGEVFNEGVSKVRLEMFVRAVEDLPFEAIAAAAQQHVRSATFFPKPAELRTVALGSADDRAELAWTYVLSEVRRVGWVGTPRWPDAATERAALGLYGGSWRTLCENLPGSGPELLGFRKSFIASYGAAARQQALAELPPSRAEAKAALADLDAQLAKRGLLTGKEARCGQMVRTGTGSTTCRRVAGHDGACS